MLWWRGPDWHAVGNAFTRVVWWWVVPPRSASTCSRSSRVRPAGTRRSSRRCPSRDRASCSSSRRSASACSETSSSPAASASSRASSCSRAGSRTASARLGDPARLGRRAPDVRPLPGDRARRSGCCLTAGAAALGDHEPDRRARSRSRGVRVRRGSAHGAAHGPVRDELGTIRKPARAGAHRPRRHARAVACGDCGGVPVARLALPALRGVGGDARVRHPPAARRRRASCSC